MMLNIFVRAERYLGKGEVVSSILTGSTTVFDPARRHVLRDLVADKDLKN